MKPIEPIFSYPPLRKIVFKHSLLIIGLYTLVGVVMMGAVFLASGITPKLIHLNYDSIAAATQMNTAWEALKNPQDHNEKPQIAWIKEFDDAISFEDRNISEPGEQKIAKNIRNLWITAQKNINQIDPLTFKEMRSYLSELIHINEVGMFNLAIDSNILSHRAFIVSTLLFVFSILLSLYLADNLAITITTPIKELAETLRRKPLPGSKLKLPKPTSLEMRIFTHEMLQLWERVSELQKLNLEKIFSQGKKLEAVLSSVDDAILVLDNQDQVIHCNQGMVKLIGLDLSDILGQCWQDLPSLSANYIQLRNLLKPDIISDQVAEFELDQRMRVFSGRCRPFFDEQGRQIGSIYLLHDITEIRQKDRLKAEFIGVLSHELKTPLQSLGTASEILFERRNKLEEEEKMLLETIHEDVGRIRAVANEFVQVGLVDLHSLRLKLEKVPMSDFLPQWIQPFQVLAKDKNIKVQFIKEGSNVILAQIDTVKFPWSISNLISNAIRVSPLDGTVIVRLSDRESRVDIDVIDEGPGISEENQKKIFDPYFQGSKELSGFLGLGLTITKEVVEAHEGRIEYYPKQPYGSIFRISLPLPV